MAKEDKKIDFESSLKELESIVEKLEDENINLEDSVKSFEKGMTLVKECQKQLQSCLLYTSPSPRDRTRSRMPSSA